MFRKDLEVIHDRELIETLWNVNVCSVDTNMSSIFFVDPC